MDTYDNLQEEFEDILKDIGEYKEKFSEVELNKMKKAELQKICEDEGLNPDGTKAELIERILGSLGNIMEVKSSITVVKGTDYEKTELQEPKDGDNKPAKGVKV